MVSLTLSQLDERGFSPTGMKMYYSSVEISTLLLLSVFFLPLLLWNVNNHVGNDYNRFDDYNYDDCNENDYDSDDDKDNDINDNSNDCNDNDHRLHRSQRRCCYYYHYEYYSLEPVIQHRAT